MSANFSVGYKLDYLEDSSRRRELSGVLSQVLVVMIVARGVFSWARYANHRATFIRPHLYRDVVRISMRSNEERRFFATSSSEQGCGNGPKTVLDWDNKVAASNDRIKIENAEGSHLLFAEADKNSVNSETAGHNRQIRNDGKVGGNVDGAQGVFAEMKENNIDINTPTYTTMMNVVGMVGRDVDGAQRIFAEMKENNIDCNVITYNTMMNVIGNIGRDVDGARRIFAEMKEKNIDINTRTYNTMIRVEKGCSDNIIRLFEEMQLFNIPRNGHLYVSALSAKRKPFSLKVFLDIVDTRPHIDRKGWRIILSQLKRNLGAGQLQELLTRHGMKRVY